MPDDAIERARDVEERTMICVNDIHALATQLATGSIMPAMFRRKTFARLLAFASQQAPGGWRPIAEYRLTLGERVNLCWKAGGGFDAHVELGTWSVRKGWCNTYGKPFHGDPDYFQRLPAPPAMLDAAPSVTLGEVG